jgi:hypothetical protein
MKKYEHATNSTQSNTQTTKDLATRTQPDIGMLSSSFSTSDTFYGPKYMSSCSMLYIVMSVQLTRCVQFVAYSYLYYLPLVVFKTISVSDDDVHS